MEMGVVSFEAQLEKKKIHMLNARKKKRQCVSSFFLTLDAHYPIWCDGHSRRALVAEGKFHIGKTLSP